jgi:hypothetical protein
MNAVNTNARVLTGDAGRSAGPELKARADTVAVGRDDSLHLHVAEQLSEELGFTDGATVRIQVDRIGVFEVRIALKEIYEALGIPREDLTINGESILRGGYFRDIEVHRIRRGNNPEQHSDRDYREEREEFSEEAKESFHFRSPDRFSRFRP